MPKILHSLYFRLGALYMGIFCASVFGLSVLISITTENSLTEQLRAHIESNSTQLMGDYLEDGIEELRHDIQERVDADDPDRLWYFLENPQGKIEFDHLQRLPESGWHQIEDDGRHLMLLVIPLKDQFKLGIGSGLDKHLEVKSALQKTFFWALLATLLMGLAGGWLVSRGFLTRLEKIKNGTERFGSGDLKFRLKATNRDDDFDQLSTSLNSMFARIETLVGEVQRVTSNIAHDLRTPLGRAKQKLEAIERQGDLSAKARREIEEVSDTLDGLLGTFSALMRIAEVELGTRRSEFKKIKVHHLFERVSSAYELVVEESGRSIQFSYEAGLEIFGDEVLLVQLLVNLVENCIQHTPVGTKIIFTALKENGKVQVVVADNGPGISEAERGNVTKAFYKIDPSRSADRNSGLGLSLVAAVATLHEAKLSLEDNNPGLKVILTFS